MFEEETEVARKEPIDRGLVRAVVGVYARISGVTYEDAHQILTTGTPKGAKIAPDKWEASRFDDEYRRARMDVCRKHYQGMTTARR